jgi:uncharacterized protein
MPKRILVLAGRGRFSDQWHDAAATSHEIATALSSLVVGAEPVEVVVRSTFIDSLYDLDEFDLLVLNISRPQPGYRDDGRLDWDGYIDKLVSWATSGGRVLAVHQTLLAAEEYPALAAVIGGHWVEGISGHPPISDLAVRLDGKLAADIAPNIGRIETFDEDYQRLELASDIIPIGISETSGVPTIWLVTSDSHSHTDRRTIVSTLGHDARSYTPSHNAFLKAAATWLLGH